MFLLSVYDIFMMMLLLKYDYSQNSANEISSALTERLYLICPNCTEQGGMMLDNSTVWCKGNHNQALFRAILASYPCQQCRACFEFWLSIPTPFLRLTNQILLADTTCPPYGRFLEQQQLHVPRNQLEQELHKY